MSATTDRDAGAPAGTTTETGAGSAADPLPPLAVGSRIEGLRSRLQGARLDALVVTDLSNLRYLTGFTGSAGVVVVTPASALLVTDGRYRTQSQEQVAAAGVAGVVDVVIGGVAAQREALRDRLSSEGARRIGLEEEHVSWAASRRWAELFAAELSTPGPTGPAGEVGSDAAAEAIAPGRPTSGVVVPASGLVEALREVKDAGELARMARAAQIADEALAEVLPMLSGAGREDGLVTESAFALALDTAMRRRGAEGVAFETIVAAGPNAAKPHHEPSERVIRPGDPVVVDFGALFEGYRSDMTRTFCVGGPPEGELARVFAVVADSQAQGVAAVRAGVGAADVDAVCRQVVDAAGWAERFEHGTGHGVGLDIHEAPTVGPLSTAILAVGMVVTVEPGVYLPGVGGVRIEDTVVVTADGCRPLTTFTKDVAC